MMSGEVASAQQEIIDEFSLFDDWMDRYQYLIDLGRRLPPFPEELRREITAFYRDDVLRVQDLIGRDLATWLE